MKTIFSGIQPTGNLHIGNYLGAIKQWVEMQDKYKSIFCVVDLHAITLKQEPKELRQNIRNAVKTYIASGINPDKSIIFKQSDISEHSELAWILNTVTRMSDLNKMTQFKDKGGEKDNISVGLFDYPVLMAADILLYDTDVVPVGEDQKQHVELARDLAKRFNHQFGETFKVPEVSVKKEGARIMGLDDPSKKMSKSATSTNNYIALNDDPEKAAKKIMKAVTDTEAIVRFDEENKPGISNLLNIYHLLTEKKIEDIEKEYKGRGYGDFKKDLADVVKNFLITFQAKYNQISDEMVDDIFANSYRLLKKEASKKLVQVHKIMGIK